MTSKHVTASGVVFARACNLRGIVVGESASAAADVEVYDAATGAGATVVKYHIYVVADDTKVVMIGEPGDKFENGLYVGITGGAVVTLLWE